jgi:hypothetical protein
MLIIWCNGKVERAMQRANWLQGQNLRAMEEITDKLDAIAAACSGQPALLLESAAHLRGAADEMRWQYNNRELLLNDQLELLSQQARALARLRYEAITLQADFGAATPELAAFPEPGNGARGESAGVVLHKSGFASRSGAAVADGKVVTLKEHLRQL